MNPTSVDVKDMLEAEELGLTFATDLFVGFQPDDPDDCVTVFDSAGAPPDLTLDPSEVYDRPGVNIRIRNASYPDGWTMANDIKRVLQGRHDETWNGTLYSVLVCTGDPLFLNRDKRGRSQFVINVDVQRR